MAAGRGGAKVDMSPGGGYGVGMTSKHEAQQQLGTDDVVYDVTLREWVTIDEWFELNYDEVRYV